MPARGRKHVGFDLDAAQLQAAVAVAALASVDAVTASRAALLVDDQDFTALGQAFFDEHVGFERAARAGQGMRGARVAWRRPTHHWTQRRADLALRRPDADVVGTRQRLRFEAGLAQRGFGLRVAAEQRRQCGARYADHLRAAGGPHRIADARLVREQRQHPEHVALAEVGEHALVSGCPWPRFLALAGAQETATYQEQVARRVVLTE